MDIVPESLLLLTLNRWQCGRSGVFIINFEHVIAVWGTAICPKT